MKTFKSEQIPLLAAILIIGYLMIKSPKKSSYAALGEPAADEGSAQEADACADGSCDMQPGAGLASSLLPKEVKPQEDFGLLKTDRLLKGQSFIHGMPGSLSGSLRNANHQLRNDPVIERKPVTIFNQSTIVADRMRPRFEIGA